MIVLSVLLAVVAGVLAYRFSPLLVARSLTRPLPTAVEEETIVLAACVGAPRRIPYLLELSDTYFLTEDRARLWEALHTSAVATITAAGGDVEAVDEASIKANSELLEANLATFAQHFADPNPAYTAALDTDAWLPETRDPEVVEAAMKVYACGIDRTELSGALPIITVDPAEADGALVARVPHVSARRRNLFTVAVAVAVGTVPWFVSELTSTPLFSVPTLTAAAALLALIVTAAMIAWVDLDTLYLDVPVWAFGTAVCWLTAGAYALSVGNPASVLVAAITVVVITGLFEGVNWIHKKLRGRDGQGFADNLIMVATIGVPTILVGDWLVAYWCVMAGLLAAVAVFAVRALMSPGSGRQPFAFGPMLAVGWYLGLLGYLLTS